MFRIDKGHVNLAYSESVRIIGKIEPAVAAETGSDSSEASALADSAAESKAASILSAAEKEAKERAGKEASRILSAAHEEAEEILQAAKTEADEVFEEAKQKGYELGFSEGSIDGRKVYEAKAVEDDAKLRNVIDQINTSFRRLTDGLENETLELALQIIRRIISFTDEDAYAKYDSMIRNALRQMKPTDKVTIRISPDECERFFSSGNIEFKLDNGVSVMANILKEQTMSPGDLLIDTEQETINAGFDTQLLNVELLFKSGGQ